MKLPEDPVILLSVVNTFLRDKYENLSELCDDYNVEEGELVKKLDTIGYSYNPNQNQFK